MLRGVKRPGGTPYNVLYGNAPVAGPGEGPGGAVPPLFLDQTEARRAEKKNLETTPPLPPYLRVWMRASHLSEGLDPPQCSSPKGVPFSGFKYMKG